MEWIILGLVAVFILYSIIKAIVNRITNRIEDKAIEKSNIKTELELQSKSLNEELSSLIQANKEGISQIKQQALSSLSGLQDRIQRDKNKRAYISEVLPYKKKSKRRRY